MTCETDIPLQIRTRMVDLADASLLIRLASKKLSDAVKCYDTARGDFQQLQSVGDAISLLRLADEVIADLCGEATG